MYLDRLQFGLRLVIVDLEVVIDFQGGGHAGVTDIVTDNGDDCSCLMH